MTLEQREQLNNFKSVLSMMYDTISITELIPEKSAKALIRVKYRNVRNSKKPLETFFWYDLATGNNSESSIKDMKVLPISNNYVLVEKSLDGESCFIKILDRETLDIIEETVMSVSDSYKHIASRVADYDYGYGVSLDGGYVSATVPVDESGEKNIHGKPINLDYTFTRLRNNMFISNVHSVIRLYDNIEDMNIIGERPLETFEDKIVYYPILNPRHLEANLPQVLFMHIITSDRLYAYNFEDNKIHEVMDTRYKISIPDFIDKLRQCLETSDKERKEVYTREYEKFKGNLDKQRGYERVQFELDCNSLINLVENKFDFNRVEYERGSYLTLRTLLQCVKEYQRDYNGESNIRHKLGSYKSYYNPSEHIRDVDKEVMMSLTPYKIKSMLLIDEIRELQDSKKLGKLIVTDKTLSFDELIEREGLY